MNRNDVLALQSHRGYPLVSVLAPTHRTSPDNKVDPLTVRGLVDQAGARVLAEHDKREAQAVLDHLAELVDAIDWDHTLDGIALFASPEHAELHYLPFAVEGRVVVDETFATRDLVAGLARSRPYHVLVLSERPTRLYHAVGPDLEEVVGHGFPAVHKGPGGERALSGGRGVNAASQRQEHHKNFFRDVDHALAAALSEHPTPVVVVGVQRYLGYYQELTRHGDRIVATLLGSHDKTPAHELGQLVWPLVSASFADSAQARLADVAQAVSAGRCASGLPNAWRAAAEGRGAHLVVDASYHRPGVLDAEGLTLTLVDDRDAPRVIDDAVDELIEVVMQKGGEVTFVDGGLDAHEHVALITRY